MNLTVPAKSAVSRIPLYGSFTSLCSRPIVLGFVFHVATIYKHEYSPGIIGKTCKQTNKQTVSSDMQRNTCSSGQIVFMQSMEVTRRSKGPLKVPFALYDISGKQKTQNKGDIKDSLVLLAKELSLEAVTTGL